MLRQDPHLRTRGLAKPSGTFVSSPGIIKHPQTLVVPLPLVEVSNTDKIKNDPKTLGVPVKPDQDIFAESKPEEEQEKSFKETKTDELNFPKAAVSKKGAKKRKNPHDLFFDF